MLIILALEGLGVGATTAAFTGTVAAGSFGGATSNLVGQSLLGNQIDFTQVGVSAVAGGIGSLLPGVVGAAGTATELGVASAFGTFSAPGAFSLGGITLELGLAAQAGSVDLLGNAIGGQLPSLLGPDFLTPNFQIGDLGAGGSTPGASGGFVLYPSRPNLNSVIGVYSK
jgi:hypothetical protein